MIEKKKIVKKRCHHCNKRLKLIGKNVKVYCKKVEKILNSITLLLNLYYKFNRHFVFF